MATVTLHNKECRDGFLPQKCMRCGEPTSDVVNRTFTWSSPYWYFLLCVGIGILIVIIIRLVIAKRMTVDVPICSKHRNHWGRATAIVVSLILIDVAAAILLNALLANGNGIPDAAFFTMLGTWAVSLPLMIYFALNMIRPTRIDEKYITLKGVDAGFAKDVAEMQRVAEEDWRKRNVARAIAVAKPVTDTNPPPDRDDRLP